VQGGSDSAYCAILAISSKHRGADDEALASLLPLWAEDWDLHIIVVALLNCGGPVAFASERRAEMKEWNTRQQSTIQYVRARGAPGARYALLIMELQGQKVELIRPTCTVIASPLDPAVVPASRMCVNAHAAMVPLT